MQFFHKKSLIGLKKKKLFSSSEPTKHSQTHQQIFLSSYNDKMLKVQNEKISPFLQLFLNELIDGHFGSFSDQTQHDEILYAARHTINKQHYSVKVLMINDQSYFDRQTSFKHCVSLSHIGLTQPLEMSQINSCTFLVFEPFDMDLGTYIKMQPLQCLSECKSKFLCYQILVALAYLHNHQITHNSIRFPNILLRKISNNLIQLKLANFGLSSKASSSKKYTYDFWSIGVLVHQCIQGNSSVDFTCEPSKQMRETEFFFISHKWGNVSHSTIDFINLLVHQCNRKKPSVTARSMLRHDWLKDYENYLKLRELEIKLNTRWLTREEDNDFWETLKGLN